MEDHTRSLDRFAVHYDVVANVEKTESNENKIQIIENNINKLDRDLVETRAEIKSLHDQMEMERQFYLQTQQRK